MSSICMYVCMYGCGYLRCCLLLLLMISNFVLVIEGGEVVKLPAVIDSPAVADFIVKNRPAMAQFIHKILSPESLDVFPDVALEFVSPPPFLWSCSSCNLVNRCAVVLLLVPMLNVALFSLQSPSPFF
eukprot:m.183916 g.183916  ORF g.183916 m.183916 type:complete len:128 (-) comp13593_c1_seq6:2406-2789(-)